MKPGKIAYVLKGFGRTSETFITNEIYWLERGGLNLAIFSLLRLTDQQPHAINDAIQTQPHYLPPPNTVESANLWEWFRNKRAAYGDTHRQVFLQRPLAYLTTLATALFWTWRYRDQAAGQWRKSFIKEFLQAGHIAAHVLADREITHLHAHFAHTCTTVTMFASRLTGLPFSFTAHAKDIYLRELNPGDLLRVKIASAKFVVTCTEANRQHLLSICTDKVVHTIYHGLDVSGFVPLESLPKELPLILSVGRMVEKKGFTDLLTACGLLQARGYRFTCRIIGGGEAEFRQKLQAQIAALQLEDIATLHGSVTQEKLKTILPTATVFALPCRIIENGDRDGIPNVLVESLACRVPVVSTDISGIPELIENNVTGLLVPQRDADALADALARLLDDTALRERLAVAGRAKVLRDFDMQNNVTKLRALLTSTEPSA